jgi:hypothetical protein
MLGHVGAMVGPFGGYVELLLRQKHRALKLHGLKRKKKCSLFLGQFSADVFFSQPVLVQNTLKK